jgi:hypothetical protein
MVSPLEFDPELLGSKPIGAFFLFLHHFYLFLFLFLYFNFIFVLITIVTDQPWTSLIYSHEYMWDMFVVVKDVHQIFKIFWNFYVMIIHLTEFSMQVFTFVYLA